MRSGDLCPFAGDFTTFVPNLFERIAELLQIAKLSGFYVRSQVLVYVCVCVYLCLAV